MDTKYIVLLIGGTVMLTVLVVFVILFIVLYQKRYYKHLKEKQLMEAAFAKTLLDTRLEIKDQTLQNVSTELHDNFGQMASLIKINLNTLQFDNVQKATEKINETKDLVKQLIADIKSLSVSLNGDRIAKIGLIKALEIEAQRLQKLETIVIDYAANDDGPILNNEKSILLYRMAQEILNNILKHAKAKQIKIKINNTNKIFTLAIEDDGVGFDVAEKINAGGGAGMLNLKNRAKHAGASLSIESNINKGTTIIIALPH